MICFDTIVRPDETFARLSIISEALYVQECPVAIEYFMLSNPFVSYQSYYLCMNHEFQTLNFVDCYPFLSSFSQNATIRLINPQCQIWSS